MARLGVAAVATATVFCLISMASGTPNVNSLDDYKSVTWILFRREHTPAPTTTTTPSTTTTANPTETTITTTTTTTTSPTTTKSSTTTTVPPKPTTTTATALMMDSSDGDMYFLVNESDADDFDDNSTRMFRVIYNESYCDLGFDYLYVEQLENKDYDNDDNGDAKKSRYNATKEAYFAAGYAEGYLTFGKIQTQYFRGKLSKCQNDWIDEHLKYMNENADLHYNESLHTSDKNMSNITRYWTQVALLLAQMESIAAGYNAALHAGKNTTLPHSLSFCFSPSSSSFSEDQQVGITGSITFRDVFLNNFNNELGDIRNYCNESSEKENILNSEHCSALITVTDDDVYFAHDTWTGFTGMQRVFKSYQLNGSTVAFSGYAGIIASGDDWYMSWPSKLATMETTNDYNGNVTLAKEYIKPHCVSEFLRAMIANYIADKSKNWVDIFSYNNSGTYCNQWMVADMKLFDPDADDKKKKLPDDFFWIAEQMPGLILSQDNTSTLREKGYWASYNIPSIRTIYVESGFLEMYERYGDFFSYTEYARPRIFKRNHSDVKDLETMQKMMRYNDWQNDEFSIVTNCSECKPQHNPCFTISCRADLTPADNNYQNVTIPGGEYYRQFLNQGLFGAIDSKITSYRMLKKGLQGSVICGPTTDQQRPFSWALLNRTAPKNQAVLYNFSWTFFNGVLKNEEDDNLLVGYIVAGVLGGVAVIGIVAACICRCMKPNKKEGEYARLNEE